MNEDTFYNTYINNSLFADVVKSVEDDIKSKCSISVLEATEAYYELKGLERLLGKLKSIDVNYEQEKHSLGQG